MFIVKPDESDFWTTLESGMRKNASFEEDLEKEQINRALNYLSSAAASLNLVGLKKEAEMVADIQDVCEGDEATKGLDSETMVKNLAEKGWVFNADDGSFEDEEDVLEVSYTEDIPSFTTIRYSPEEIEEGWIEAIKDLAGMIKEEMEAGKTQYAARSAARLLNLLHRKIPHLTEKALKPTLELVKWVESLDLDIERYLK